MAVFATLLPQAARVVPFNTCTLRWLPGQLSARPRLLPMLPASLLLHVPEMLSTLLAVCMVANRMMLAPTAMFCTGSSSNVK